PRQGADGQPPWGRAVRRHPAGRAGDHRGVCAHRRLRPLGERELRSRAARDPAPDPGRRRRPRRCCRGPRRTAVNPAAAPVVDPTATAIGFFFLFVPATLVIPYWAARRTKTTSEYFAAASRITAGQNGFALAGDYMSAASFLGIAGMVSLSGFDGLI